jgi:hypothetical protein
MASFDLSQIKPIPGFDSKKWLRKVRAEIQRETEGMTDEQIRERRRRIVEEDECWQTERAKTESADS